MLSSLFNWILGISQGLGYLGVGLLMTVESSFFPFPSEIIIPPAAYLAAQGRMDIIWVIIVGTLGSVLGATINYFLALSLGRLVVYRLAAKSQAKYLFITPEKISRAEKYFLQNANSATFFGRLVPVIRQLISLPAGFSRMNFFDFILYTSLGSLIWVSILAALGYGLGANQYLLAKYYREIYWLLLSIGILWLIVKIFKTKRNN